MMKPHGGLLLWTAIVMASTAAPVAGQQSNGGTAATLGQTPVTGDPSIADDRRAESDPLVRDAFNLRYQLRKGDILDLNFPFVPALNQTATVQPDGYITLRVVGDLRVEGKTVPELTRALRAEYASILREPVVTVELKDFEKPYFVVAGEVERPGKYDLRGQTTVTQAVAVAGGLKEAAKHSQAVVFRRLPTGGHEVRQLNLKKMFKEARLGADMRLEPGDMLFIPKGRMFKLNSLTSTLWLLPYLLDKY